MADRADLLPEDLRRRERLRSQLLLVGLRAGIHARAPLGSRLAHAASTQAGLGRRCQHGVQRQLRPARDHEPLDDCRRGAGSLQAGWTGASIERDRAQRKPLSSTLVAPHVWPSCPAVLSRGRVDYNFASDELYHASPSSNGTFSAAASSARSSGATMGASRTGPGASR